MEYALFFIMLGMNISLIVWIIFGLKSFENKVEAKVEKSRDSVNHDVKEFHGRLCFIEERLKIR